MRSFERELPGHIQRDWPALERIMQPAGGPRRVIRWLPSISWGALHAFLFAHGFLSSVLLVGPHLIELITFSGMAKCLVFFHGMLGAIDFYSSPSAFFLYCSIVLCVQTIDLDLFMGRSEIRLIRQERLSCFR